MLGAVRRPSMSATLPAGTDKPPHLGAWEPPSRITFGNRGKPDFQQGPYDNPTRIVRTLDRSVGPGNYHHTIVIAGGA